MSFITGIRSNFAQSKVEIIEASGGSIIQTVDGGAVSVGPKCCSRNTRGSEAIWKRTPTLIFFFFFHLYLDCISPHTTALLRKWQKYSRKLFVKFGTNAVKIHLGRVSMIDDRPDIRIVSNLEQFFSP